MTVLLCRNNQICHTDAETEEAIEIAEGSQQKQISSSSRRVQKDHHPSVFGAYDSEILPIDHLRVFHRFALFSAHWLVDSAGLWFLRLVL